MAQTECDRLRIFPSPFAMSLWLGTPYSHRRLIRHGEMCSTGSVTDERHKAFICRNGCKLHAFTREEAPWPFSFNREVLEQCALDHAMILKIADTQSFMDMSSRPPKRCLDLGTALGDWIIDTAQRFPKCTFVGFDLVDIQIPLRILDPSIAKRIEWVHGNFLTHRLPFSANEFDYIHLEGIGFAVPEDKVSSTNA
ncbi:hypothetical protein NM688_g8077 [Phlebia brevispora]|uniref:Uncharacterized protein n=1 Tax=Phlebia brevispora TaxID=194682 RepID=A0ACC1RXK5_9APHY|nr:hypothetical protein NM688_g8077 [Phlebia brevispora]